MSGILPLILPLITYPSNIPNVLYSLSFVRHRNSHELLTIHHGGGNSSSGSSKSSGSSSDHNSLTDSYRDRLNKTPIKSI